MTKTRRWLPLVLLLAGCPAPSAPAVDAARTDDGGVDAAVIGDSGPPIDTGVDARMPVDTGAPSVDAASACAPTVVELAGIADAAGLALLDTRLYTTRGGDVVSLALDGTDAHTLAAATGGDFFRSLAAAGNVVVASTDGHGPRIARANADGMGSATYFDLSTYAAYDAAVPNGAFAFTPRSGHIATDGTTIFVEDQNYGGLVALDATTLAPLGFLYDGTDSALGGTSAWALNAGEIVALIDRSGIGITPLTALRVFDVSTPSAMTRTGEILRTDARVGAVAFDTLGARYVYTTQEGVYRFSVDAAGVPSASTRMFATADGRQARGLAIVSGAFVVGTPDFTPSVDRQVQVLGEIPAGLALRGSVPLTAAYGDVVVGGTGEAFVTDTEGSNGIARITLPGCP